MDSRRYLLRRDECSIWTRFMVICTVLLVLESSQNRKLRSWILPDNERNLKPHPVFVCVCRKALCGSSSRLFHSVVGLDYLTNFLHHGQFLLHYTKYAGCFRLHLDVFTVPFVVRQDGFPRVSVIYESWHILDDRLWMSNWEFNLDFHFKFWMKLLLRDERKQSEYCVSG